MPSPGPLAWFAESRRFWHVKAVESTAYFCNQGAPDDSTRPWPEVLDFFGTQIVLEWATGQPSDCCATKASYSSWEPDA